MMPEFLHFWQGAVSYADYLDMPHDDWQRMVAYMHAYNMAVQRQIAGR